MPLLETTPRSSGTLLLASALRLSRNLAILGALLLIVIFTPLVASVARPLAGPWTGVDNGVLIILSGSTVTYPDPTAKLMIGLNTYWRIVHAISAWRDDHFRTILVPGYGTAESVKPLLITNVILETSITVENKATNTRENALFSKPILEGLPGPYVLMTSDYQMFRASRWIAHQSITVETLPAPDPFKGCNARVPRAAFCC